MPRPSQPGLFHGSMIAGFFSGAMRCRSTLPGASAGSSSCSMVKLSTPCFSAHQLAALWVSKGPTCHGPTLRMYCMAGH